MGSGSKRQKMLGFSLLALASLGGMNCSSEKESQASWLAVMSLTSQGGVKTSDPTLKAEANDPSLHPIQPPPHPNDEFNWSTGMAIDREPGSAEQFGNSLAVVDDTIVVGVPGRMAVEVFQKVNGQIVHQATLYPHNPDPHAHFGYQVALAGKTIVVGAEYEASCARQVSHENFPTDKSCWRAGAAYVFTKYDGVWRQTAYLKGSKNIRGAAFGSDVDISDDTIVVSAESDTVEHPGGAVYVFKRENNQWVEQAFLKATNADYDDFFGSAVAISGDTIVVGAKNEASNLEGVFSDRLGSSNNSIESMGAAYVFERDGHTWNQVAYLKPSFPSTLLDREPASFGTSVAISGVTIVVGADYYRPTSIVASGPGAAFVYRRENQAWKETTILRPSLISNVNRFGNTVAISKSTVVVSGIFGFNDAGRGVHIFKRDGLNWVKQVFLQKPNWKQGTSYVGGHGYFGAQLAISKDLLLVGAPYAAIEGNSGLIETAGQVFMFERTCQETLCY